jgi:hypothetical protein
MPRSPVLSGAKTADRLGFQYLRALAAGTLPEIGLWAECLRHSSRCDALKAACTCDSRCRHRLGSAVALQMPNSRVCGGGSLFPQEGCPLQRYGRVGQDRDANDFGVCLAGPVCPTPNENILLVPHVSAQSTPCEISEYPMCKRIPSGVSEYSIRLL